MVYMITYDLNEDGQNYADVIRAIKSASNGIWCSYWKSSFLIISNLPTATDVFNRIRPYLDGNDKVFVVQVQNNYQGLLSHEQWKYINTSIFG